jgi:hypothetical protein
MAGFPCFFKGATPVLIHDVKVTTYAPTATSTAPCSSCVSARRPRTNNIRVKQCDTVGGSYADLLGSLVGNHATDNPLVVDIFRPKEGFLKYEITRGTTTTIDAITWIQYNTRSRPVTQPSGTQVETFTSPAEGTA